MKRLALVAPLFLLVGCVPIPEATTPEVCIAALDAADELLTISVEAQYVSADAIEAAFYRDADALERAATQLDALTQRVNANPYSELAKECRTNG